jgi:hypothetical protein
MGPLQTAIHLLSFLAPAFFMALGLALIAPWLLPAGRRGRALWWSLGLNFMAGATVLMAGLWYFGHDGKMATYAALVLVMASVQWLVGRGWRART